MELAPRAEGSRHFYWWVYLEDRLHQEGLPEVPGSTVYLRDVWSRLPALLVVVTSTFGSILKVDSTKKVCKKLQGTAANTASWATNVGNERGEVLIWQILKVQRDS